MSFIINNTILKGDPINSNDSFPGIILQIASNKSLWEEESRDPKNIGSAMINPFL
jgi:hypothetical protein